MAKKDSASSGKKAGSTRVQVKNPVSGHWVKLDTRSGRIVGHKKSPGAYKGIPRKK